MCGEGCGTIGKSDYVDVLYFFVVCARCCWGQKFIVAPESNIPKTIFWTVVFEVSSLHLNVNIFNVCSGHRHRQRPTSARCFSDPPMMFVWVACSL